jgi:hypothetical protein
MLITKWAGRPASADGARVIAPRGGPEPGRWRRGARRSGRSSAGQGRRRPGGEAVFSANVGQTHLFRARSQHRDRVPTRLFKREAGPDTRSGFPFSPPNPSPEPSGAPAYDARP